MQEGSGAKPGMMGLRVARVMGDGVVVAIVVMLFVALFVEKVSMSEMVVVVLFVAQE